MTELTTKKCRDCAVRPGERHEYGCDVARCSVCGWQHLSCYAHEDAPMALWSGRWAGEAVAEELGWYARLVPGLGWVPCRKDDADAVLDMNRVITQFAHGELVWTGEDYAVRVKNETNPRVVAL